MSRKRPNGPFQPVHITAFIRYNLYRISYTIVDPSPPIIRDNIEIMSRKVQLSLIIIGLFLALPFVVTNEYVPEGGIVGNFTDSVPPWVGSIQMEDAWIWTDNMLMLIMGGLPWQVYFQRNCS